MKFNPFKNIKRDFITTGSLIKRYYLIYAIVLSLISAIEFFLIIRAHLTPDFFGITRHVAYYVLYWVLFVASTSMIPFVVMVKKDKLSVLTMAILLHSYALLLIAWGTVFSAFSIASPKGSLLTYYTIIVIIGGIVVMDPTTYTFATLLSFLALVITDANRGFVYFGDTLSGYIDPFIFIVMAFTMGFKNYRVYMSENRMRATLTTLAETDMRTGLKNDTAYIQKVEEIKKDIESNKAEFSIIVMDVNNLKETNDVHGHDCGNKLIEEAARIACEACKGAEVYRTGGDEFVVILEGETHKNRESIINELARTISFSTLKCDDSEIVVSVAFGIATYNQGMSFQSVFKNADDAMYQHKGELKKKYGFKGR